MAKARALDRRRRSVRNIRKITRTMELIATARFKKAMDRSVAARDYTKQLVKILENIASVGADVVHPLLDVRPTKRSAVLVLSGNRGLCGGYNSNIVRQSVAILGQWRSEHVDTDVAVSGKRGISALKFRGIDMDERYTAFEDKPAFDAVMPIGRAYLEAYAAGCALLGLAGALWLAFRRRGAEAAFLAGCILLPAASGLDSLPRYVATNPVFLFAVYDLAALAMAPRARPWPLAALAIALAGLQVRLLIAWFGAAGGVF